MEIVVDDVNRLVILRTDVAKKGYISNLRVHPNDLQDYRTWVSCRPLRKP